MLLRNQLYAGIVDVAEYGVRGKRGDFEPLVSDDTYYCVQAVVAGRTPSLVPQLQGHPDFPLRGFVRCESCGRVLTGSWSKGRSRYYAYYQVGPGCRVNPPARMSFEMPLGEFASGSRLQIPLESKRGTFSGECDRHVDCLGAVA